MNEFTGFDIMDAIENNKPLLDYKVWEDGGMLLTDNEKYFNSMVLVFDLMGLDFTTGTPEDEGDHYYIEFQ